jgi:hypothetical protein
MLITTNMWHPAGNARQYEAAGSRAAFSERWNSHTEYSFHNQRTISDALQRMLDVLTDEQKVPWINSFTPAA